MMKKWLVSTLLESLALVAVVFVIAVVVGFVHFARLASA